MERWRDDVAAVVRAFMQAAARALYASDLEGFVRSLSDIVGVYERNPSCAQAPDSQLNALLLYIRTARSVYELAGRSTKELLKLDLRAQALRQSIH